MKNKFFLRLFLAALMMVTIGRCATADNLKITAPAESLCGDLVILSCEWQVASDGETPPSPPAAHHYSWTVIPPETVEGKTLVCNDGRTIVFASRLPGTYYFTVAGVIDGKPVTVTHRLDNIPPEGKPLPLPPVEPDDVPPPPPPINIDAEIAALRQLAQVKAVELVRSQHFDREKKALAESFLATAQWIEQSAVCNAQGQCETVTPEQARTKQRDNARKYLGSVHRNSWQTWEAWDKEISKHLTTLDARKPLTVEQIGQAYKQIGLGLQ